MDKYFSHHQLRWPTDSAGNISHASLMKMDDSYRLRELLLQSTMLAYVALSHNPFSSSQEGVYYEQSVSFLKRIREEWIKELRYLQEEEAPTNLQQDLSEDLFRTPLEQIEVDRARILRVAELLLTGKSFINYADLAVYDHFNYGGHLIDGFFRGVASWIYGAMTVREGFRTQIDSFALALPALERSGYGVTFAFMVNEERPLVLTIDESMHQYAMRSMLTFLTHISIPGYNSDNYLAYVGSCALSTLPSTGNGGMPTLIAEMKQVFSEQPIETRLRAVLHNNPLRRSASQLETSPGLRGLLVHFLASLHERHSIVIGPRTHMLLNYISGMSNSSQLNTMIELVLGRKPETQPAETPSMEGLTLNKLDLTSAMFKLPENPCWGLEAAEEEDPEDVPEEPEVEPVEEPAPDEEPPGDPDPEDEPDEPKRPTVRIRVPQGSYLFKIRESNKTTLDEWLYLLEVSNIVNRILEDPPDTLKETHRVILTKLVQEWIYLLDVESVESFLGIVLETVPKAR